jgi:hypothetical protein
MKIGDTITPASQTVDAGVLARLFKALPNAPVSKLEPYGSNPLVGKMFTNARAANAMGIEGGFGVSTANAESYFGKKGTMLRKRIRIDKCPWPDGQDDIRVRCTFSYGQSVGGVAASSAAPDVIVSFRWLRNTTLNFSMTSGTTPANVFQEFFGFGPGSAGASFKLEAHGVGVGQPLVQDDGNPYTNTFITLDVTDPTFTNGATYWYTAEFRHHMLPCPQWSIHHINFPGDAYGFFEAANFSHGAIGLVMASSWEVEATGWDTGFDDDASWHAGTPEDPYVDLNGDPDIPNSYELPDKPASSPYNVGVP